MPVKPEIYERKRGASLSENGRSDAELVALALALPRFAVMGERGAQKALAQYLGRTPAAISQWKGGHRPIPLHTRRLLELELGLQSPLVSVSKPTEETEDMPYALRKAQHQLARLYWQTKGGKPEWSSIVALLDKFAPLEADEGARLKLASSARSGDEKRQRRRQA